ncbi:MAG: type II toxin-antitoxin system VapC family toxin [Ornithinimicrobium sp.]|uniref:type II toxin-antitoxin system VapC family toxin n=1 Tax=Ornithinimicrobium sp. TaxID=1977084 RepID=UPI003D9B64A3
MSLLLDTHVFLWWLADHPRLSREARTAIGDGSARVFVSAATLWEAEIKAALGRLHPAAVDLAAEVAANGFTELAVTGRYTRTAALLPAHHTDPFDRMLVAQAQTDGLRLVTADRTLQRYDVPLLLSS